MVTEHLNAMRSNEEKEAYVMEIANTMIQRDEHKELLDFVTGLQDKWTGLTTVRLTKIVKQIYDAIPINHKTYEGLLAFLGGLIDWAKDKKMLRVDLQCKEVHAFLSIGKYGECLDKIKEASKELKKYDDKVNLISLYIYESRAYYELKDLSRARAALTSARALAVSTVCPAQQQAQIDLLNGMYLSDESVYSTASSYFIEALEGFVQDGVMDKACVALRYILLGKIMAVYFKGGGRDNVEADILTILNSKYAAKVKNDDCVKLLLLIVSACHKRDLCAYNNILCGNKTVIEADAYIYRHLRLLYDILLDKNILKIIEPYSHIKISFIALKLGFSENIIEDKLRKMILDKAINGILDHVSQCLILHGNEPDESHSPLTKDISILRNIFTKVE